MMSQKTKNASASSRSRYSFWLVLSVLAVIAGAAFYYFNFAKSTTVSAGEEKYEYDRKLRREVEEKKAKAERENVELRDLSDPNVIYLNVGNLDVTSAPAQAMRQAITEFEGNQMRLVKFSGAIEPSWFKSLVATGVTVIDYIPNNAYLVYGNFKSMTKLQELASKPESAIIWEAEYTSAQRVDPSVMPRFSKAALTGEMTFFNIQLVQDAKTNAVTRELIAGRQLAEPKQIAEYLHYVNVTTALSQDALAEVANRPDVISIQPYTEPIKLDERQNMIVAGNVTGNLPTPGDYFAWLTSKGFTQSQFSTSNFVVDVTDSGIDNATTAPNHFGLYTLGNVTNASRVVYNRLEGTANSGSTLQGCDGHGNLNSHIIGGYVPGGAPYNAFPFADANGFRYGLGVAPFVKVGSSVVFDPGTFTSPNYENLQSRAYNNGARISSNSWGSSANSYTSDSQRYDALVRDAQPTGAAVPAAGNQQMVIVFAAGNNGAGANTVGSPSTGKNLITVGASEGVQAFGAADQCGTADASADNLNDIVGFSSRGPTSDGRKKPDIVAPGTHITGGVAQTPGQLSTTPAVANGSANTCFDASGVCAGPGTSNFFPVGQQWYTASSGTSHSTPAVAGGAALIRQHFLNLGRPAASPAMTKAVLTNGARYMTGVSANDNFYSNSQGMGLMDLNRTLDGVTNALLIRDQEPADKFTATAQTRVFNVNATTNKLMRITLVWTDAPGATTGSSVKNNLNLSVVNGANTFLGNVFTGQISSTGGTADALNNVESVYLPGSASGNVAITVTAANINSDGVPNDADVLDQDFAIIVTEVEAAGLANIGANGSTLVNESYVPANGVADPGETVTVNLGLLNTGFGATNNLVATLQPSASVLNPSAPQSYGSVAAAGGTGALPFTFVPAGACGSTITLTLQLQDGATNLGNVTYSVVLGSAGAPLAVFSENFDGVTAPALPSGWTTARTGTTPPALFATTATTPDTAPNAAFTSGATTTSTNSLISPTIAMPSGSIGFQLSFRQTRSFEFSSSTCWDGGILEISTDGGTTFNNVTSPAVGGTFSAGGYNGSIATNDSNPLAGQAAFCGAQAAYGTTTLNLPGTLSGQNVKFRWRGGWDSTVSAASPNWRIDTINLTASSSVCAGTTTSLALASSQNPSIVGQPVTFTATVSPVPSSGTVDFIIDGIAQRPAEGDALIAGVPVNGSGVATFTTSALGAGNHTVAARFNGNGSFGFSQSALGGSGQQVFVPTAAGVEVSGRVTTSDGRAIANANVILTDVNGVARTARTNSFGVFRFEDVAAGQNYILDARAKGRTFGSQVISVSDSVTDLVFVAQ